jgi:hypothetical protein
MIPAWRPTPGTHRRAGELPRVPEQPAGDDALIRPFLLTGGRTAPSGQHLRVETLVLADPAALYASLQFEPRVIVEMCQVPLSVADIAVRLAVPLGVARVLVGDLVLAGHLRLAPQQDIALDLLERIRQRVRAL